MTDLLQQNTLPTETPAPEAPPVEPVKEVKPPDDFAERFATLTKRERQLQMLQQELKQDKEAYNEWKSAKENAKRNPMKFLESHGLDYDTITRFVLNNGKPEVSDEVASVRDELEKLRKERDDEKRQSLEQQQQAEINAYKRKLANFVDTNENEYEFIKANEAYETVFDTIVMFHEQHGRILSEKEACDLVEKELEKEAERFFTLNKVKNRFAPKSDEQPAQQAIAAKASAPSTLTNNMAPKTSPNQSPTLSDEESLKRAASLIKWA